MIRCFKGLWYTHRILFEKTRYFDPALNTTLTDILEYLQCKKPKDASAVTLPMFLNVQRGKTMFDLIYYKVKRVFRTT